MLEVSTLRSPPTPTPTRSKAADHDEHQQLIVGFVGDGDHDHAHAGFPTSADCCCDDDDFVSMVDDSSLLLDYIDFSSCCDVVPCPFFDADGDVLPDLEADPTDLVLAEFSSSPPTVTCRGLLSGDDEEKPKPPDAVPMVVVAEDEERAAVAADDENSQQQRRLLVGTDIDDHHHKGGRDHAATTTNKERAVTTTTTSTDHEEEEDSSGDGAAGADANCKSSSSASAQGNHHRSHSKTKKQSSSSSAAAGSNSHGKRKVKVDWTPELHRRFVQAVEQLGIDKAVPSRILEIMGIQCLTRHNIASHLQKYRSHRKHLMTREAEAASWAQKRQMYAAGPGPGPGPGPGGAGGARKLLDVSSAAAAAGRPWVVPTIGFPPPAPFCRPLHVWGHPPTTAAVEAAAAAPPPMLLPLPLPLPVWPRHLAPPPRPTWAVDPAYWQQQQQQYSVSAARKWGPPPQAAAAVTQGTPVRFPVPHPIPMYRPAIVPPGAAPPPPPQTQSTKLAELQQLQLDAHPSKESIDAAIGDVLVKPWLPLPLGLKPPSLDSVMSELHKQGIPKVPPASSASMPCSNSSTSPP